jgi:predicted enzyme related to lactoylglutathione lyase
VDERRLIGRRQHEEAHMGAQVIHFEVTGKDAKALQAFYSKVFDWTLDTNNPGGYGMYRPENGQGIAGGIGAAQDGGPGQVTFYVHSDDPQGLLRKVEAAGGRVIMPLTEVAPETTIGLFADPEGHVIGIM